MLSANKKAALIIGFVLISVALSAIFVHFTYFSPSAKKTTHVEISKGLGVRGIGVLLEKSGVIKSEEVFIFYVVVKNAQNKLRAGEYQFRSGESISEIIERLVNGDIIVRNITIPEGLTVGQIAELLDINGVMSKEEFLKKAKSVNFARELLGESVLSFEGYLFPDTYSYAKGITPEELIRVMVSRFQKVYDYLKTQYREVNLTNNEIVTLASIIEKETGDASERPLISAVFQNRLKIGMRLESDPTVIYGLGAQFNGNLTKEDLRAKASYNSYNTYTNPGLPPGPISNPGKDSLEAVFNPAEVDYLYFVSKGDGTHYFSSEYAQHREAVFKYQKQSEATEKKHW